MTRLQPADNPGCSAYDQFGPEGQADPPIAHPFHRRVDRAAAFEADDHALADTRLERRDDHRAAGRDVAHGHQMHAAAEEERAAIDQIFVPRLRAPIDVALLCAFDRGTLTSDRFAAAKPARLRCPHLDPLPATVFLRGKLYQ